MTTALPKIAVLGGTGAEGSGLAYRWGHAGYAVVLAPRWAVGAAETARDLGAPNVAGTSNAAAAAACDIAVLTVPFTAQLATLAEVKDSLAGKILIDVTVPLVPPKVSVVQLPPEGSAAARAQGLLGPGVKVVAAFHNVSAHHLKDLDYKIDCDVLVCGDDAAAREETVRLIAAAGMRGIHAGALANAAAAEAMTSVLIAINRRYKVPAAGIRITGLPEGAAG
jgi:NADPH-dependent F420 reductase